MKYMILIYHNSKARDLWASFSEAEQAEGLQAYARLNEELTASGELIVTHALADASLGRGVQVRDGRVLSTDGPYAEAKEMLAGFYLVECESMDRAAEIAARIPEAAVATIEVRPILTYAGLEM